MFFDEVIPYLAKEFAINPLYIQVGIILGLLLLGFILIRVFGIEDAYLQVIVVVAFLGFMAVDGLIPLFIIYIFAFGSLIAAIFKATEGGGA